MADNNVNQEELQSMQASMNSVSRASLVNGVWENNFFGNDIAFAHTTEEVNKKAWTTLPEPSDFEINAQDQEQTTEPEEETETPDPQEPETPTTEEPQDPETPTTEDPQNPDQQQQDPQNPDQQS